MMCTDVLIPMAMVIQTSTMYGQTIVPNGTMMTWMDLVMNHLELLQTSVLMNMELPSEAVSSVVQIRMVMDMPMMMMHSRSMIRNISIPMAMDGATTKHLEPTNPIIGRAIQTRMQEKPPLNASQNRC